MKCDILNTCIVLLHLRPVLQIHGLAHDLPVTHLREVADSMRKTRLLQRRPDTYRLIDLPIEATPLYKRYFPEKEEK